MITRMSSAQLQNAGLRAITDAQTRLASLQQQVATGKKLQSAADDPNAAVQLLELRSELTLMQTHQENMTLVNAALSQEESVISSVNDALNRARELSIQGRNEILAQSDREAIATEMDGLREQLLSLANSTNFNGESIFAGSRTDAPAYSEEGVFQGDDLVREINIARAVTIKLGHTGTDVFERGEGEANVFKIIENLAAALRLPAEEGAERFDIMQANSAALDESIDQIASLRTSIGTRMTLLDDQIKLNDGLTFELTKTMSNLEDLDMPSAISELNLKMVTLQAAQQTFVKTQSLTLFDYL